jgi:hypothetical protein
MQGFVERNQVKGFQGAFGSEILFVVSHQEFSVCQPYVGFDGVESFVEGVLERDGLFIVVMGVGLGMGLAKNC